MPKKGDVIKGTDVVYKGGDRITGEMEFSYPRTRITGFDGLNNHVLKFSADDSDKLLHVNRKGANDYEFFIYSGGGKKDIA